MSAGQRGSGRTWRQIEALPDGSVYLVHSATMVRYCRSLVQKMGRRSTSIRFATAEDFERLEGTTPAAVAVDHAYGCCSHPRKQEAYEFITSLPVTGA